MLSHLLEIEDAAAREGVSTFQIQMEVVVLSLLDDDRAVALGQIEAARLVSLENAKRLPRPDLPKIQPDPKPERVATAMLQCSFERMRTAIEAPDADDASGVRTH